jgi:hypothetical protein
MNLEISRQRPIVLAALVATLATACAMGPKVETEVYERPDGVIVVETLHLQATVTAVDAAKREVTLKPKYGETQVVKADEAVANFNQIRVGDEVNVVIADEVAVTLIRGGAPQSVGEAEGVALAPLGAKPGVVMVDAVEVTGTIIAIDGHEHTVTLELLDGSTREIKVGKHRDLSKVALGDSVRVTLTEAVAISVETPQS